MQYVTDWLALQQRLRSGKTPEQLSAWAIGCAAKGVQAIITLSCLIVAMMAQASVAKLAAHGSAPGTRPEAATVAAVRNRSGSGGPSSSAYDVPPWGTKSPKPTRVAVGLLLQACRELDEDLGSGKTTGRAAGGVARASQRRASPLSNGAGIMCLHAAALPERHLAPSVWLPRTRRSAPDSSADAVDSNGARSGTAAGSTATGSGCSGGVAAMSDGATQALSVQPRSKLVTSKRAGSARHPQGVGVRTTATLPSRELELGMQGTLTVDMSSRSVDVDFAEVKGNAEALVEAAEQLAVLMRIYKWCLAQLLPEWQVRGTARAVMLAGSARRFAGYLRAKKAAERIADENGFQLIVHLI